MVGAPAATAGAGAGLVNPADASKRVGLFVFLREAGEVGHTSAVAATGGSHSVFAGSIAGRSSQFFQWRAGRRVATDTGVFGEAQRLGSFL